MNNRVRVLIAAACGFTMGGVTTYLVAAKKIAAHYQIIADEEIISVKETYRRMYKQDGFETAADAASTIAQESENDTLTEELATESVTAEDLEDAGHIRKDDTTPANQKTLYNKISEDRVMARLRGEEDEDPDVPEPVTEIQPGAIEVTQIEEQDFDPTIPYTISYDAYYDENEYGHHDKLTYTYYEEDDTLTDERDRPVPDLESIIGREALKYFGVNSKDKNIVHVRNERLESDYEVVKDPRSYLAVVVGVKNIWDQDEERKAQRKMRADD